MAASKNEPVTEEMISPVTPPDPKEGRVMIMIPITEQEKSPLFVCINGYPYYIQRGVEVSVPRAVYEVIRNSNQQMMAAESYAQQFVNK